MSGKLSKNVLVLKIEYHREMANALEEDSTSKNDFILPKAMHARADEKMRAGSLKESLQEAAKIHREKMAHYVKLFQEQYPNENADEVFDINLDWMMDEIQRHMEPTEDPDMNAHPDNT